MTVQKFIQYNSLDLNGQILNDEHKLELNILENSGNYLVHKDILRHQISRKQSTSSTKTRSEVRGGGRKPWKQKGTGQARAGSNRSPLWKGGGVIFGPKPKVNVLKLNKKERKLALQTLLYNKRNNVLILNGLEESIDNPKTKFLESIFKNCNVQLDEKVLLIVSKKTVPIKLSVRNMKNVELISATNLNTLSLLKAKQILLTPLALKDIKETFCG
jgi:large subunit ribosomal protein L4|tara:strand:+ start:1477 stop:2124 length:648 start_codon:yes stop_codon:yes gene_type:complete